MKTEKTFIVIFILGLILKYSDVPGASVLLIFTLMIISMLYFPMAFYFFSDKGLKNQNIALSIAGGMAVSILPIGILFKLMRWPGSGTSLIGGIFFCIIVLGFCFGLRSKAGESLKNYYKNYITRLIFWLSLGIIFFLIPTSALINLQYRNNPDLAKLIIKAHENPYNIEDQRALDNYYDRMDSMEIARFRKEQGYQAH